MNKPWLAAALCLLLGIRAEAAALSFNVAPGDARFDPVTGLLVAEGTVTASEGLSAAISGTPFRLAASFVGMDVDVGAGTLLAHFAGVPGIDLDLPGVLAGEFLALDMAGALGDDLGVLIGSLELAGALAHEFGGAAAFVSLQLNMSAPFDALLFATPFTSSLDGRVIGVSVPTGSPAPLLAAFLAVALLAARCGALRRRSPCGGQLSRRSIH